MCILLPPLSFSRCIDLLALLPHRAGTKMIRARCCVFLFAVKKTFYDSYYSPGTVCACVCVCLGVIKPAFCWCFFWLPVPCCDFARRSLCPSLTRPNQVYVGRRRRDLLLLLLAAYFSFLFILRRSRLQPRLYASDIVQKRIQRGRDAKTKTKTSRNSTAGQIFFFCSAFVAPECVSCPPGGGEKWAKIGTLIRGQKRIRPCGTGEKIGVCVCVWKAKIRNKFQFPRFFRDLRVRAL